MWLKLLLAIVAACSLQPQQNSQIAAAVEYDSLEDRPLNEFILEMEELVLNTTDRALRVTTNVYRNLSEAMSPQLLLATGGIMRDYVAAVNATLERGGGANFTEKRKLFKQFKLNNFQIDQLRLQLDPLQPAFQFQLISEVFYNEARNVTEFDNLYLEFMNKFAHASQQLWDTMSERTVQEQEEMLEILDEIANERQLREKDKLYDEFIEIYLFKPIGGDVENRELF